MNDNHINEQFANILRTKNLKKCFEFKDIDKVDFNYLTSFHRDFCRDSLFSRMIELFEEDVCLALLKKNPQYKVSQQPQELFTAIEKVKTKIIRYILDNIENCDYTRKDFYVDKTEDMNVTVLCNAAYHLKDSNFYLFEEIFDMTKTHIHHISGSAYYNGDHGHHNAAHNAAYSLNTPALHLLYNAGANFSQEELYDNLTPCETLHKYCTEDNRLDLFINFMIEHPDLIELEKRRLQKTLIRQHVEQYKSCAIAEFSAYFIPLFENLEQKRQLESSICAEKSSKKMKNKI